MIKRGRLISFEGIDGSGKSTQIKLLAEEYARLGMKACVTREPGGSSGAEAIRKLLISGDISRWSSECEILLFTAARRDHVERLIEPALASGEDVLSDRFIDSTRIYQGKRQTDKRAMIDALHSDFIGIIPQITILLDLSPAQAEQRIQARLASTTSQQPDRFDARGIEYLEKLREDFLSIADEEPKRFSIVNAARPAPEIAAEIRHLVFGGASEG